MFKNVATKIALFAFTTADGVPKTGDAANLTAYVSKDYGSVTVLTDTSATEMDATNAKGWYLFDVTATECNADALLFTAKSSTSGVTVVGQYIHTTPNRFTTLVIDAAGLADANAVKIGPTGSGTAQTARDIGASVLLSNGTGTGQMSLSSGLVTLAGVTHTGAVIPTVTNVTTVNGLAAGVITAASIAADAITDAKVAADVTIASVTGTVGSVTGAVGSVTGNVGGNVTGSVGGVTGLTVGNLDVAVSTRLATAGYTAPPSVGAIADQVWDEAMSGHLTGGTTGASLNGAGAAGDPWTASIPGAYGAGTAGYIVGTNLDAAVSTAGGGLDAAGVRSAVGMSAANLDTQLAALAGYIDTEVTTILAAVDTEVAAIKAKTDNLPASPAATGDCLTAAGIRSAVGMSAANLDTQLAALAGYIDTEVTTILAAVDTEVAAIKAKTDNLPASPAATGDCLTAAGIRSAVGMSAANLDTQLDALPTAAENAAASLTTQMTESYAADGVAPTLAQATFMIQQSITEKAIAGTTMTVKKLNGSTTAATFTLDDGTNPTSITRAT